MTKRARSHFLGPASKRRSPKQDRPSRGGECVSLPRVRQRNEHQQKRKRARARRAVAPPTHAPAEPMGCGQRVRHLRAGKPMRPDRSTLLSPALLIGTPLTLSRPSITRPPRRTHSVERERGPRYRRAPSRDCFMRPGIKKSRAHKQCQARGLTLLTGPRKSPYPSSLSYLGGKFTKISAVRIKVARDNRSPSFTGSSSSRSLADVYRFYMARSIKQMTTRAEGMPGPAFIPR